MNTSHGLFRLLFLTLLFFNIGNAQTPTTDAYSVLKNITSNSIKNNIAAAGFQLLDPYKEITRHGWDGQNWSATTKEISIVDTTHPDYWQFISTEHRYSEGVWINEHKFEVRTTPMLGENPQFISSHGYTWSDGDWRQFSRIRYHYTNNLLDTAYFDLAVGQDTFMVLQRYIYEYNDQGVLSSELVQDYLGEWTSVQLTTMRYNEMNLLYEYTTSFFNGQVWYDSLQIMYTYNESGQLLEEQQLVQRTGTLENDYKIVYNYLDNSLMQTSSYYIWEENAWMHTGRHVYEYTPALTIESKTFEDYIDGSYLHHHRALYSYDEAGRETEIVESLFTGAEWLNYVKITTAYAPTAVHEPEAVIKGFSLAQNFPNPFNPETTIRFSLADAAQVSLTVYDVLGNEIAQVLNEYRQSGYHQVRFNAAALSSGIYFYTLRVGSATETKKMHLLK